MTANLFKDIHPTLALLIEMAPALQSLISQDLGITVTDLNTQLCYLPGRTGHLNITPGSLVLPDSVSMTSMLEDRLAVKKMERRLGQDYVGRAVSVKDEEGDIIGSFGTVEVVTHQSILKEMVRGISPGFVETYNQALKASRYDVSVLILGETGTGKEVFAQLIVEGSSRCDSPFIAISCASIPPTLFESEMFGYEAGSFTGAQKRGKRGYFEQARDGTIFLDEVGDLDLNLQAKILRVLETGKVMRIGGKQEINIQTRIIAATNQDLRKKVRNGKFRADLFFRLSSIVLTLPPLRERKEDIDLYINKLFQAEKKRLSREKVKLSPEAMQLLRNYEYPGNIRELKNVLRQAIIFCERDTVLRQDVEGNLLSDNQQGNSLPDSFPPDSGLKAIPKLSCIEKTAIMKALAANKTKTQTAKALGISRDTLYRKIIKYELN